LIKGFARFVLNSSADTQFLTNVSHSPEYMLVRTYWLPELNGIGIEAGLNATQISGLGMLQFSSANSYFNKSSNSTTYLFTTGNASDKYAAGFRTIVNSTGAHRFAFIYINGTARPLAHTLFYDVNSSSYAYLNGTGNNLYNSVELEVFYGYNSSKPIIEG
ncbi:hypothetical protein B1B_16505, partial [mine drainage metagenome]